TSPTLRLAVCRYSAARRPGPIRNSIQPQRFRCVPVSARRTRSPSVTIPTRAPRASMTGKPLNLRSSISRMASVIEASGEMHTGSGVMTSAALMAYPPHLNFRAYLSALGGPLYMMVKNFERGGPYAHVSNQSALAVLALGLSRRAMDQTNSLVGGQGQ